MTRREFLATVGWLAAAGAGQSDGGGSAAAASEDPGWRPQTEATRLVFHDRFLAQLGRDEVLLRDPLSLAVTARQPVAHAHGLGVASDGALIVPAGGAADGLLRLVRIAGGKIEEHGPAGVARGARPRLFPAARADEVILAEAGGGLTRYRMVAEGKLWPMATLDVGPGDQSTLMWAGGDRILHATAGHLIRAASRQTREELAFPDGWAAGLAPGPDADHVWTTQAAQLHLARLANPVVTERRFDVSPWKIVHLAAAPGGPAALLLVRPGDPLRFAVAAFDERGERWRADLPAPRHPYDQFVAVSTARVVVGGAESLMGWDAASGKPVAG